MVLHMYARWTKIITGNTLNDDNNKTHGAEQVAMLNKLQLTIEWFLQPKFKLKTLKMNNTIYIKGVNIQLAIYHTFCMLYSINGESGKGQQFKAYKSIYI